MIANRQIPESVLKEYGLLDQVVIPVEPSNPDKPEATEKYVVKKGDTLWAIGKMFNTTWQKLAEFNKLKNPDLIFPNQIIMIK